MQREIKITEHEYQNFQSFLKEAGEETQAAIGYLSTWSYNRFPKVYLYVNYKEKEIIATYCDENDKPGYIIGAIFRDGKFSFHS